MAWPSIASNTGRRLPGEELMTPNTSAVAVCRSKASRVSVKSRDMRLWRRRQKVERAYCQGDNVIDPPRLMRLAGTVNYPPPHKIARGYKSELVELHCTQAGPIAGEDFDFGGFDARSGPEQPNSEGKNNNS